MKTSLKNFEQLNKNTLNKDARTKIKGGDGDTTPIIIEDQTDL